MKVRLISCILIVCFMFITLCGCASGSKESHQSSNGSEQGKESTETLADLETLYQEGMEVLAQMGDNAPILFPETDIDYLNEFYPGLADIELKQFYAGVAPVTNAPFEIVLVEVANEKDVPAVLEIYQRRVDRESGDSAYPENAQAWLHNCKITSRGCYVFLAVLMEPCEIPAQFILD